MFYKSIIYFVLIVINGVLMFITSAEGIVKKTDIVLNDMGIEVTRAELENAISYWPKKMRMDAVDNDGIRYEMLNQFMLNRKIAEEVKKITEETDSKFYWQREFAIRNLQNKLYINYYKENLKIPDMKLLAKEKLLVNRDKYAKTPEERKASHILIGCKAGSCDRKPKRISAKKLLKELREGADFEKMVEKYSDDPGSKARKGALKRWMRRGESSMDGFFVEGVYSIKKQGDYSEVVESRFGLHIIRLDDIKPVTYKLESMVLPKIIEALENKYRTLSERAFVSTLALSEKAFIDDLAVSEMLAPYKAKPVTQSTELPKKKKSLVIKQFRRP